MTTFMRKIWTALTSVISRSKSDVAEETEPIKRVSDSHPPISQPKISETPKRNTRLADAVKEKSTLLQPQTGPLPVYIIPLEEEQINISGCKCFSFGKESAKPNRTIMVLGATGAGKSTLINGMINYILGVEWDDSFRFKLVDEGQSTSQAHSQTSEVTAYKINHQEGFKIEHSLTIVDTPGFGDTRGIERDKEITEQLHNLFSAQLGVSEIDAICFVAQASLARLTPTQKYVFDSMLSIFGKDVAENIRVLVTFADGQRPPVLVAINASGVPCPKTKDKLPAHFKFNNSALFADNKSYAANSTHEHDDEDDEDGGFDQMFWDMGTKSMKRFFAALNVIDTKSLTMTKEVLRERKQLENSVENLQKQVKLGLAKLEEIKETAEKLKEHEAEISRNENFEFVVTITKPVQESISGSGNYITNCQQCHNTCHYPCGIPNDADKRGCIAMGSDGYCTECPGKCYWNVHFNQKYKWEYKDVKEKRTVKELKEKYLKAAEAKTPVQALIDKLKDEYKLVQVKVVKLMERSANCLNRLKEIALKPNPLSTPEYIDMLIEGEKSEAKPGYKQRIQYLKALKEKAEYMAKVERGETFLESPPTHFESWNLSQFSNNQDEADTDTNNETEADAKSVTNQDEEKADAKSDTNQGETEADAKSDTDQDETEADAKSDTNQDETEADAKSDTNQDETEADAKSDTNQDETEADAKSDANQGEAEADAKSDTNQGEAEADAKSDTNQDETEADAKSDTNQDETEADAKSDANQGEAEADAKSDTNQGEAEADAKSDTNQDETEADAKSDTNQDAKSDTNQDETEADAKSDANLIPIEDETEPGPDIDSNMNEQ